MDYSLVSAVIFAALIASAVVFGRRLLSQLGGTRAFEPEAWAAFADNLPGFHFTPNPTRPQLRGRYDDATFTVTAGSVALPKARSQRRLGRSRKKATTTREERIPTNTEFEGLIQARVPAGLTARRRGLRAMVSSLMDGGSTIEAQETTFDKLLLVGGEDVDGACRVVADPEVQAALIELADGHAGMVLNERTVRVIVPGMVTDLDVLEDTLRRMARVIRSIEQVCEPLGTEPEPIPSKPTGARLRKRPAPPAPPKKPDVWATPMRRSLGNALRGLHVRSGRDQRIALLEAKLDPYAFQIEVRYVRAGPRTIVVGDLRGSAAKTEVSFPEDVAPIGAALTAGQTLSGTCTLEDYEVALRTAHVTLVGQPTVDGSPQTAPTPQGESEEMPLSAILTLLAEPATREPILKELEGKPMTLAIEVREVVPTGPDAPIVARGGRTVVGVAQGTTLEIRFTSASNAALDMLKPGSKMDIRGVLADYNPYRDRPVLDVR